MSRYQAYIGTDDLAYWRFRDDTEFIRYVGGQSFPTIPDAVADVQSLFPGVKVEVPPQPRAFVLGAIDAISTPSSRGFQLVEHELGIQFGALRVYPVLTENPGSQSWNGYVGDRLLLISLGMYKADNTPIYFKDITSKANTDALKKWAAYLKSYGPNVWLTGRHEPDHRPVHNNVQLPSLGTPAEFSKYMTYVNDVLRGEGFAGRIGYNLMDVTFRTGKAYLYHFPSAQFVTADGYSGAGGPSFLDVHLDASRYAANATPPLQFGVWETQCAGTDTDNAAWWKAVKDSAGALGAKHVIVFTNQTWSLAGSAKLAAVKELGA